MALGGLRPHCGSTRRPHRHLLLHWQGNERTRSSGGRLLYREGNAVMLTVQTIVTPHAWITS